MLLFLSLKSILAIVIAYLPKSMFCGHKYTIYQKLSNGLFFNQFIEYGLTCYLELLLAIYLFSQGVALGVPVNNGFDYIGAYIFGISVLICFVLLPIISFWILYSKPDQEAMESNNFFIGSFYQDLKTPKVTHKAYQSMYMLRRFSFLAIPILINMPYANIFQIMLLLLLNLLFSIYIGSVKAFQVRFYNRLELLNEWFIAVICI